MLARGGTTSRPRRRIPDTGLTRQFFADLIGKRDRTFLAHVYSEFRLDAAHGNLNEYFGVVLDPANVLMEQRVDATNEVLATVLDALIRDEIEVVRRFRGDAP